VLSPYPVKEGPSLAPDDHRFVTVYRGRVLAFFAIYNNTFDATPFIGKVYSISEE